MCSKLMGIDLGTTYSCVAVYFEGKVEVIANEEGSRTMPSVVAFIDNQRLVGDAAKHQIALHPRNTVYAVKRLIGRKFSDPHLQSDLSFWPFSVIDENDEPQIVVNCKGAKKCFTPEEISSMILSKLKHMAEVYLGESISAAVIAVPAYFNDSQRQATKDAGTIAGLNVMHIINEPSAAALTYGVDADLRGERKVLIFDLGGGAFDVSVLSIRDGSLYEVQASAGDGHLGGEDFDRALIGHFCDEFERKFDADLRHNARALRRLRTAAERCKCILSTATECTICIDALFDGIDFYTKITRARFEELNSDLFSSTLRIVETALRGANVDKHSIDDVVLIGGATRIPKIRNLLQNYFEGKQLNMSINADEAVAYGAALQAAILAGIPDEKIQDVRLQDVTPLSLGIEVVGGLMATIIARNTHTPCKHMELFSTYVDNQKAAYVQVYEGERAMTHDNNLLGTFKLCDIPPAPRGVPIIEVEFDVDTDGILRVSAVERSSGRSRGVRIESNKGRLSQEDIARMVAEAATYADADHRERERVTARSDLDTYMYIAKDAVGVHGGLISREQRDAIVRICEETAHWMADHQTAEKENYMAKYADVQTACLPLMFQLGEIIIAERQRTAPQAVPRVQDASTETVELYP